jgi:hypothetical protein
MENFEDFYRHEVSSMNWLVKKVVDEENRKFIEYLNENIVEATGFKLVSMSNIYEYVEKLNDVGFKIIVGYDIKNNCLIRNPDYRIVKI